MEHDPYHHAQAVTTLIPCNAENNTSVMVHVLSK